ncbi:MAG: hypothetical protein QOD99_2503 [Chthoniobacter sp.]|nr:hypothetical protein [Chthoniobacter sp.]
MRSHRLSINFEVQPWLGFTKAFTGEVRNHQPISIPAPRSDALKRSVTRPFRTRGAYPERYYEALQRWQHDQKEGKALICSTSIQDWLKEHR